MENNFTVENIIRTTKGILLQKGPRPEFSGVSIDSRTIKEDEIFFCIKGDRFDGHKFIGEVIKKGVKGIVASEDISVGPEVMLIKVKNTLLALRDLAAFVRSKYNIPVVAITGSNGKTTTKEIIANILMQKFQILKSQGNFNNMIGVSLTLLKLNLAHQAAILELGMNKKGEIAELAKLVFPQTGVITNVGDAHLEFLDSREGVAAAKGELLEYLSTQENSAFIANADDPYVLSLVKNICQSENSPRIIFYGINSENSDVRAEQIRENGLQGVEFVLNIKKEKVPVNFPLPGRHNIYNALAASAAGVSLGFEAGEIKNALESFRPLRMHLEKKVLKSGAILINDAYNANPGSMQAALDLLSQFKEKETCLVIGDMLELGESAFLAHKSVGKEVMRLGIKNLISLGELAKIAALEVIVAGMPVEKVRICQDQEEVFLHLQTVLKKDWIVLFKGSRRMGLEKIVERLEN